MYNMKAVKMFLCCTLAPLFVGCKINLLLFKKFRRKKVSLMEQQNKRKISIQKSTFQKPNSRDNCFVYKCGNVVELVTSANRTDSIARYQRRPNGEYIDLETGEIKKCSTSRTKRIDNIPSLHSSFKQLRRTINTNIEGNESEKFVTLTYGKPMKDNKQAYEDFRRFVSRTKYRYKDLGYIAVLEPQENQNWHFHVFLKNMNGEKLYIPKEELEKLWGKGYCHIESISADSSDNMRCILYS